MRLFSIYIHETGEFFQKDRRTYGTEDSHLTVSPYTNNSTELHIYYKSSTCSEQITPSRVEIALNSSAAGRLVTITVSPAP